MRPLEGALREASYEDLQRDLADALEQQQATSEILRIISTARTDVQPVFDAIIKNAIRLCEAANGTFFRFDLNLDTRLCCSPQSYLDSRA